MYTLKSIKENEFIFQDIQTEDVEVLTSEIDVQTFVEDNIKNITPKTLLKLFDFIEDESVRVSLLEIVSSYGWKKVLPKAKIPSFLEKNIDIIKQADWDLFLNLLKQMKDLEKINLYNNIKDNDNLDCIYVILDSIKNEKLKTEYLEQNKENLAPEQIVDIARSFKRDKLKLDCLNKNKESLEPKHIADIARSFKSDKLKLDCLNQIKESLTSKNIADIISCLESDKLKLDCLNQNKESLEPKHIANIVMSFVDDKLKTKYINQNKEYLEPKNIADIVMSLEDDKLKIKYINHNKESLASEHIADIVMSLVDDKLKIKYINKNKESLEPKHIADIEMSLVDDKLKIKYINQNKESLETKHIADILMSLEDDKLKIKYINQNKEFLGPGNIAYISKSISPDLREKVINEFVLPTLYAAGLAKFGKETASQIIKYCVYSGSLPDISKATQNYDLFEKFKNFCKGNLSQELLDVVNIQKALDNFNQYYDLIKDCFSKDLTEKEQAMLISVLTDKNIRITSKAELENYPAKRSEHIDQLAKKDIDEAIIYLFTGLSLDDYQKKHKLYFGDKQLNDSLNEFSEELQTDILLMQISKELINLIQNETIENKRRIVEVFKNDLAQEFSQQGACLSVFRNEFADFSIALKRLYGKELQESLATSTLPEPKKVDGIDVITLQGEDFKLLVHGLNAYGKGSDKYEDREIGRSYICTSLISNSCLYRAEAKIYYGFKNISRKSLALEGPHDLSSHAEDNSLDITARSVSFLKTDELLRRTITENASHNEVVLYRSQEDEKGNVKLISPDYIVSFGDISDQDKAEAKRLNIPIVLVYETIYEKKNKEKEQDNNNVKEKPVETTKQVPVEIAEFRDIMLQIIEQAKNNCSAVQQEAIMSRMQKEFKMMQQIQQSKEKTEGRSV